MNNFEFMLHKESFLQRQKVSVAEEISFGNLLLPNWLFPKISNRFTKPRWFL